MAMQKIAGSYDSEQPPLKVTASTQIEELHGRLGSMWVYYVNNQLYQNPALLTTFFGEYQAYVGTYAEFVHKMRSEVAKLTEQETNRIYKENAGSATTFLDGLIRRTARALEADVVFHESLLSSYNKNINGMQTLIRQYGDEAKVFAGQQ